MKTLHAVAAACTLALSGCQSGPWGWGHDQGEIDRVVKEADWTALQTVEIELYDYGYRPRDLRLKAGQPYKLALKNTGTKDHYYTAPGFFRSVATRKAMVGKVAEIKAPYFLGVETLRNGGHVDLYVVPMRAGRFAVNCPIGDHLEKGSEGSITVE